MLTILEEFFAAMGEDDLMDILVCRSELDGGRYRDR